MWAFPKPRDLCKSKSLIINAIRMEPVVGFEPTTDGLQNRCSTTELNWLKPLLAVTCTDQPGVRPGPVPTPISRDPVRPWPVPTGQEAHCRFRRWQLVSPA